MNTVSLWRRTRQRLVVRSLAFAAGALLLAAAASAATTATINGTVKSVSGTVLPGMAVGIYDRCGGCSTAVTTATTDSTGKYTLQFSPTAGHQYGAVAYDNHATAQYAVSFQNDADSFENSPVLTPAPGSTTTIDFQLQLGGTVSGQVTLNGISATSAYIGVYNTNANATRRTLIHPKTDGSYLVLLPPGSYKLAAFDDQDIAVTQFYRNAASFTDATAVSVTSSGIASGVNFNLALASKISGTVVDADTRTPLPNMFVYAYNVGGVQVASTTSGSNGQFTLKVPPGAYKIVAADAANTYATSFATSATSFETATTFTLAPGVGPNLAIAMPRAGIISGHLTDSATSLGLSGTIAAYNSDGTTRATIHTTGSYSLPIAPGDYKIVAWDDSGRYAPGSTAVSVKSSGFVSVDFSLALVSQMTGTVVDADTRTPLPNMFVYAYTVGGVQIASTTSGSTGQFTLKMTPGTYKIVAADGANTYATSFATSATSLDTATTFPLAAGQVWPNLTIAMPRAGFISGHITDAATGAALSGTIAAYNGDGTTRATVHTSTGTYNFPIAPGNYKIVAWDDGGRYAPEFFREAKTFNSSTAVRVLESQINSGVDFSLTLAGHFTGFITDAATNQTLKDITVNAYASDGSVAGSITSGVSGAYNLTVAPGSYRLVASDTHKLYANAYADGASTFEGTSLRSIAASGSDNVQFAMQRGIVVGGSVSGSDRRGLANMEVSALDPQGNHVATTTTNSDGTFTIAVAAGSYKFFARDPAGNDGAAYWGGSSLSSATVVSVSATSVPTINLTLSTPVSRRRAVSH